VPEPLLWHLLTIFPGLFMPNVISLRDCLHLGKKQTFPCLGHQSLAHQTHLKSCMCYSPVAPVGCGCGPWTIDVGKLINTRPQNPSFRANFSTKNLKWKFKNFSTSLCCLLFSRISGKLIREFWAAAFSTYIRYRDAGNHSPCLHMWPQKWSVNRKCYAGMQIMRS